VFCTGVAEKYALIEQWRQQFPIEAMCQVFGVSRSGYCNWVQHEPSDRKLKWHTEFGHLNRGDMLTSEQHRCSNEKKKF
ncbi:hypothetical protein C5K02_27420, partial [Shigella flexneri]